ncbi:KAP family P-loop NTPase fold protein [Methylobacterium sp. CM6244]
MADDPHQSIKGDRALSAGDEDRLGFRDVANRIALSLVDRATEDGLVIGLEGPWGSGKSSLLFLIGDELEKLPDDSKPTIINFRPWLISNRDALIISLFGELSRQLDDVASREGDATRITKTKAKEASKALRSFVNGLSKTGAFVEFVGKASGVGLVEMAGEGVKSLGQPTEGEAVPPPLAQLKDKLAQSLRELGHRFVVTIDDVDRLEPAEVIEILRLVRSVVDLPNMIYLLCYDSNILAHSIKKAAGVKSGRSYLEKIVQLTVMVPKPEPLQLRQWFSDELRQIASTKNEDERSRLEIVIDQEGGRQLRTPRSVIRALDSMRFFWPPLSEAKADLSDLVWLQLIKDGNAKLYRWIEDYCASAAVISLRTARANESERKRTLAELLSIADIDYFDDATYRHYFAQQLPGIEVDLSKDGVGLKIFSNVSEGDRDKAIRDKRLSSPDHYRLYFALSAPSHVLTQDELSAIWKAADAGAEPLGKVLLELNNAAATGTLTKADILLERTRSGAYEALSPTQCENLLMAFSHVMDQAYRLRPFDLFWVGTLWNRAERLIPLLLSRFASPQRESAIASIFEKGRAIGWLTSLLRHETFAHGHYGERRRSEVEWLFTAEELERISAAMLLRYKNMSMRDVFNSPQPISLLFAWYQTGDEEGPRHLVESNINTDQELIDTLEGFITTVRDSNQGHVEVIKSENLSPFMDVEIIKQRIDALKNHSDLGERAGRIALKFKDGNDY